jgi:activator of 2-hydroxyglutaryl-CoA dehydratase
MRFAGIDIGSRTIELVVLKDREIIESRQVDTGFDPLTRAREML